MRSINIRTSVLALAAASAAMVSGCGTTSGSSAPDTVGGQYLIAHFPGIPAVGDRPAVAADPFGPDQFRQLQHLDQQCHEQLDPYIPGIAGELATAGLRMAITTGIGSAIGSGLGAVQAFTGVTFGQYAEYAGLSSAGAGLGSGIGGALGTRSLAVRYVQYACMQSFVARASQKNELRGVAIIPWAGATNARPMRMPTETVGAQPTGPAVGTWGEEDDSSLPPPVPLL